MSTNSLSWKDEIGLVTIHELWLSAVVTCVIWMKSPQVLKIVSYFHRGQRRPIGLLQLPGSRMSLRLVQLSKVLRSSVRATLQRWCRLRARASGLQIWQTEGLLRRASKFRPSFYRISRCHNSGIYVQGRFNHCGSGQKASGCFQSSCRSWTTSGRRYFQVCNSTISRQQSGLKSW